MKIFFYSFRLITNLSNKNTKIIWCYNSPSSLSGIESACEEAKLLFFKNKNLPNFNLIEEENKNEEILIVLEVNNFPFKNSFD